MLKNLPSYKEALNWRFLLIFLIFLYLIPFPLLKLPSTGLDASWQIAINLAIKENLIFGKDFVFTYGPLGFLETKIHVYVSDVAIVSFQLFILFCAGYFIYYFLRKLDFKRTPVQYVIFLAVFLFIAGEAIFQPGALSLYFYFLFFTFVFLENKRNHLLVLASICGLLAFYIKVNTGIIMNLVFFIFLLYLLLKKIKSYKEILVLFIAHFGLLFGLSFLFNTDIISYFRNSLHIIDAYNDAMFFFPLTFTPVFTALLIILILLYYTFKNLSAIIAWEGLYIFANLVLFGFILFKQSFVRADSVHFPFFFDHIYFIAILFYFFIKQNRSSFDFYSFILPIFLISIVGTNFLNVTNDFEKIQSYFYGKSSSTDVEVVKLPREILSQIGDKSMDVVGYELSHIYFNDLNYAPRPVPQSYSTYNEHLINLNIDKYNSPSAPDYVLYHYGSIDNRHGFWDEPKLFLSLLSNYKIVDTIARTETSSPMILFKKSMPQQKIEKSILIDTVIQLNQLIKIPESDNILFLEMKYGYTLSGKLRRLIFQPVEVSLDLVYESNESMLYRLVLPVMESGIPINKKVTDFDGAYKFFSSSGKVNEKANAFQLISNQIWIKNSFHIRIVEYEFHNN